MNACPMWAKDAAAAGLITGVKHKPDALQTALLSMRTQVSPADRFAAKCCMQLSMHLSGNLSLVARHSRDIVLARNDSSHDGEGQSDAADPATCSSNSHVGKNVAGCHGKNLPDFSKQSGACMVEQASKDPVLGTHDVVPLQK